MTSRPRTDPPDFLSGLLSGPPKSEADIEEAVMMDDLEREARRADRPEMHEEITLAEAAAGFSVSTSTLRRLLRENKLPHARQERSAKGMQWLVVAADLEALGYARKAGPRIITEPASTAELDDLRARLRTAEERLTTSQAAAAAEVDAARSELEAARAEVSTVRAELSTVRADRDRAEREAELSRQAADLMASHLDDLRGALARIPLATARGIGNAAAAELEAGGKPRRKWWGKAR